MKVRFYIVFIALAFSTGIFAQDWIQISQYMYNGLIYNPAYSGSNEVFTINLSHRSQWIGFEGAPKTQTISLHWPMKKEKFALGILMANDEIGSRSNKSLFLNYAYRFYVRGGKLSLGLKGGITSGRFSLIDLGDGDVVFDDKLNNYILPNFGIGAYYYSSKYYFGASVPLMFGYKDGDEHSGLRVSHSFSNYRFYFIGGWLFNANNFLDAKPSFLISFEKGTPIQAELNCNLIYRGLISGGLSYRIKDAVIILLGYNLGYQAKISISYDLGIGELSSYHNGSFEINLQYALGYKIKASNPGSF